MRAVDDIRVRASGLARGGAVKACSGLPYGLVATHSGVAPDIALMGLCALPAGVLAGVVGLPRLTGRGHPVVEADELHISIQKARHPFN